VIFGQRAIRWELVWRATLDRFQCRARCRRSLGDA
jgi:hypothetical protein